MAVPIVPFPAWVGPQSASGASRVASGPRGIGDATGRLFRVRLRSTDFARGITSATHSTGRLLGLSLTGATPSASWTACSAAARTRGVISATNDSARARIWPWSGVGRVEKDVPGSRQVKRVSAWGSDLAHPECMVLVRRRSGWGRAPALRNRRCTCWEDRTWMHIDFDR